MSGNNVTTAQRILEVSKIPSGNPLFRHHTPCPSYCSHDLFCRGMPLSSLTVLPDQERLVVRDGETLLQRPQHCPRTHPARPSRSDHTD